MLVDKFDELFDEEFEKLLFSISFFVLLGIMKEIFSIFKLNISVEFLSVVDINNFFEFFDI